MPTLAELQRQLRERINGPRQFNDIVVPRDEMRRLLDALAKAEEAENAAVSLLSKYYDECPDDDCTTCAAAIKLIDASVARSRAALQGGDDDRS